jgi:hypothetical protein
VTTVIDYIVQRLAAKGITECFGVPGDYAFPVCDAVDRNPNIKWNAYATKATVRRYPLTTTPLSRRNKCPTQF